MSLYLLVLWFVCFHVSSGFLSVYTSIVAHRVARIYKLLPVSRKQMMVNVMTMLHLVVLSQSTTFYLAGVRSKAGMGWPVWLWYASLLSSERCIWGPNSFPSRSDRWKGCEVNIQLYVAASLGGGKEFPGPQFSEGETIKANIIETNNGLLALFLSHSAQKRRFFPDELVPIMLRLQHQLLPNSFRNFTSWDSPHIVLVWLPRISAIEAFPCFFASADLLLNVVVIIPAPSFTF